MFGYPSVGVCVVGCASFIITVCTNGGKDLHQRGQKNVHRLLFVWAPTGAETKPRRVRSRMGLIYC